jgi:telomeric repeat-binding factor 2
MDTDICRWISEFVMRDTAAQDHVIKKLLRALPVSGADSLFKKTALLRTIRAEISEALLTETTLDNLEVMEELDRDDGAEISEALKAAYRAVAVECTVKYLAGSGDRHGKYFEAVKRVWRGRIGGLERSGRSELVTSELRRWGDDVEAAVWDEKVARRLLKVNTRNEALEAVRVYMALAWALMGLTFLQSAAAVAEADGVQRSGASAGEMAVKNAVNRFEEVAAKNTPNVGEFAAKKVNQVEEVAVNTPCVGAMHQVEEVAGNTSYLSQEVGELSGETANQVALNTPNVGEIAVKKGNQVEEVAVNTPCVGAMHQVEEVAGNTSNLSQEVGELSGETANQVASDTTNVGQDVGVNSRPELCKGEGRGLVALQSESWDLIVRDRAAAGRVDGKFNSYYF